MPHQFDRATPAVRVLLRRDAFDDPDRLFELEHDGFRCLAYIDDGQCKPVSRNRNVFKRFELLQKGLGQTFKVEKAILDRELILCVNNLADSSSTGPNFILD